MRKVNMLVCRILPIPNLFGYRQVRQTIMLVLFTALSILGTACGKNAPVSDSQETVSAVPVSVESTEQQAALTIHEQIQVLAANENTFFQEDARTEESDEDAYIEGPFYSLMDLDQDGYLELVVYDETGKPCPTFYEVTADKTLQTWTAEGDLPQEQGDFSIFDTTSKADCYYDPQENQYHYIVQDKLSLSQDDADVVYLDMVTGDTGVTFRKIGGYTFDASQDERHHFYDADGKECDEADITADYAAMTKKTMYYVSRPHSRQEAGEVYWYNMENTVWENFLLRDDYRCDKEKELTEDIRHQFYSLSSLDLQEFVIALAEGEGEDEIRYAAADLDQDNHVELIVENQTKHTYRISTAECLEEDDCKKGKEWKTEGKSLHEITDQADRLVWYSCTYSKFMEQSGDLWEDNLRESWLQF